MSNTTSIIKRRHVQYTCSLVVYLDILGFRRLVDSGQPNKISRIIRIVKQTIIPNDSFAKSAGIRNRNFSDLTVISIPLDKPKTIQFLGPPLPYIVQHLGVAQARLIEEHVLVRGSVTVGDITKSWGELFGPALNRAYDLERQDAVYPRIIFDPEIFADPVIETQLASDKEASRLTYKYLRTDADGFKFVDYLKIYVDKLMESEQWLNFLSRHKALVEEHINDDDLDLHIRSKYQWLRTYHNQTIDAISEDERDEELTSHLRKRCAIP